MVEAWDIRFGDCFDLRDRARVLLLRARAKADSDAAQQGAPCSSWSVARNRPGGPPPLRSREFPWGLPSLTKTQQKHTDEHSALLVHAWEIIADVAEGGGAAVAEHPRDPGPPFCSSWATKEVQQEEERGGFQRRDLDQCAYQARSRKPTTLSVAGDKDQMYRFERLCPGVSPTHQHHALVGRDENGNFRTQQAQEYPPDLCYEIANFLVRSAVHSRQQSGGLKQVDLTIEEEVAARAEEWDHREADGIATQSPPLAGQWIDPEGWQVVLTSTWKFYEHNNVTELRTLLWGIRRLAATRRHWGKKALLISDSAVSIGCLAKGRSSSWPLLRQCRCAAALLLGLGMRALVRYVHTSVNLADGPSRGFPLGVAPKSKAEVPRSLFTNVQDEVRQDDIFDYRPGLG